MLLPKLTVFQWHAWKTALIKWKGASKLDLAKADFVKETVAYLARVVCQDINLYTYYTY